MFRTFVKDSDSKQMLFSFNCSGAGLGKVRQVNNDYLLLKVFFFSVRSTDGQPLKLSEVFKVIDSYILKNKSVTLDISDVSRNEFTISVSGVPTTIGFYPDSRKACFFLEFPFEGTTVRVL